MKRNHTNRKKDFSLSQTCFGITMKHKWLLVLVLSVTALVAAPIVKQHAQTAINAEAKERADRDQKARPESNEVGVIELSESQLSAIPTNTGAPNLLVGNDVGNESEPNDTFGTANPIGSTAKITGNIFGNGDLDWYSFTASPGDRVYAAVMTSYSASASTDSQLRIFGSDGTTLVEFDEDDGSLGGLSSSIAGAVLPAGTGTYYVQVKHFSAMNTLRPYELYLRVQSGSPTAEAEPNDTAGTATPLPAGGWVSGTRDPALATEQDWYSMTLNAGDTVYLGLDLDPERDATTWNGRLGMALFGDANNQILVVDDSGAVDTIDSEAMFMTVKTAGTYYAFVDSATAATGGPTATYNLSVTVIPKTDVGINCTTYTSTDVPQVIGPAAGLVSSTITVPATMARIASTKVSITADHTLMADMDVNLRSPAGNNNALFNDIGAAATGGQTMMDITLDQYSSGVPFVFTVVRPMVLKPELAYRLDWFDGENPSGVWTLDIRDDLDNASGGNLTAWSLEVCEQPPVAGTVVYSEDFETTDGGYTHSGTADEWEYGTPNTAATTTTNPVADIIGCNGGTNCWKTDLDNTYNVSSNQNLVSPSIAVPATGTSNLSWAMRYQLESATFDRATVTVTEVGNPSNTRTVWAWTGATMTSGVGSPVTNIGHSAGWGTYNADISDFAGLNVQLTFHVDTDTSINFAGVAIDDVSIRNTPIGGVPNIDVSPLSLSSTQATNTMVDQMLSIGNTGTSNLNWSIFEEAIHESALSKAQKDAALSICVVPANIPWMSVSPSMGTTGAGGSTNVTATFDSTGLASGMYTGNLCVMSNDPDPGTGNGTNLVIVPVTLNVTSPGSLQFSSPTYSAGEGSGTATVTVTRTGGSAGAVTVDYATSDGSATGGAACTAGVDYINNSGTLMFADGDASETFDVTICEDLLGEGDETIDYGLSMATGGATIGMPATAVQTITDNDPAAGNFSVTDVRVTEPAGGTVNATFTVTYTGAGVASVDFETANGTAAAGSDYASDSGTLNFGVPPVSQGGPSPSQMVSIVVNEDAFKEANETFFFNLSNPVNGTVTDNQGVGIIVDRDRAYTADFDNDKLTDYSVYRPSSNTWFVLQSTNGIPKIDVFGTAGDIAVPGDYDADGITDRAIFRPSTGEWRIIQSQGKVLRVKDFGVNGDIPVQGDYDGDGETDFAVFRPSNGVWYMLQSTAGWNEIQFGLAGDIPVTGDFDGDFKNDQAVYRNGTWYILRSSDSMVVIANWGLSTDRPVSGDFDGDGSSDLTIYRNGQWWILQSLTGDPFVVNFGLATDIPAVGDFDGDGTSDITVFRPSDGDWHVLKSSDSNVTGSHWGLDGDVPVPTAYSPQ